MSTNPKIVKLRSYKNISQMGSVTNTTILCAYTNDGSPGYMKEETPTTSAYNPIRISVSCITTTQQPFKFIDRIITNGQPSPLYIKLYKCTQNEVCNDDTKSCGTEQLSDSVENIIPVLENDSDIGIPKNFHITASSGSMRVTWDPPSNAYTIPVFAYLLQVVREDLIVGGYLLENERDITINNLTNGYRYAVLLRAFSELSIRSSDTLLKYVTPPNTTQCV